MKRAPRFLLAITALSLALAISLLFDLLPFLRGGEIFHWQWPYSLAPLPRILLFLLVVALYLLGAWWLYSRRALWLALWAFAGALMIALCVVLLHADDPLYALFARTASGGTTGPHMAGAQIDWDSGEWRAWTAIMARYAENGRHVALSPPGLPMWYGLLNSLLARAPAVADPLYRSLLPYQCHNFALLQYTPAQWASAWFGILMPVWAALAVFPLYAVARRLLAEHARIVVVWWALVPALVMFAPSWNTVYPLLAIFAFWLLLLGLEKAPGAPFFVAAGVMTGVLTFINFSVVPLAGFFGFYVLFRWWPRRLNDLWPAVSAGIWFAAGLFAVWLVYAAAGGQSPLTLLSESLALHFDLERPYLPYLWLHTWEWLLFTGIPLAILWLAAAWRAARGSLNTPNNALALALAATLFVLVLSGTARGETGRVWLFFAPFVLLAAAGFLRALPDSPAVWITGAQAVLTVTLAVTLPVIDSADLSPPPSPPGAQTAANTSGANFAGYFRLESWDAAVSADGAAVILRLNWQPLEPMTIPYWFAALLVTPEGAPAGAYTQWQPVDYRYPTTCWPRDARIGDSVRLPLPDNAPAGEWWISLLAFADPQNPQRLPVNLPDGTQDTQTGLGPVRVP